MKLLVSGASRTVQKYAHTGRIGILITPAAGNTLLQARRSRLPWAVDNAAFSGFDAERYQHLLYKLGNSFYKESGIPLWVTAPDVVCNARATLDLFHRWLPELVKQEMPPALVAQNGSEDMDLPWSEMAAIFIGGDDTWKESEAARSLTVEAKKRGKFVHMGRVNTRRRMSLCKDWGTVDSVDGSGFSRFPDDRIPRALRWMDL